MVSTTSISILILALCGLLFLRNLITTYYAQPKYEHRLNLTLASISSKINNIDKILNHNVNRMSDDISIAHKISDIVTSARAKLHASRGYILRFHNGSSFSTNDPVWKFSIMHESNDTTVTPISDITKDILTSNCIQFIAPIFNMNEGTIDGIECLNKESNYSKVFHLETSKINITTLHGFFALRGIKHLIYTPIVNHTNRPIGIFCLDYNRDIPDFMTSDVIEREMVEYTSMISSVIN